MRRFWDSMIEPLLEVVGPQAIVEIGSAEGKNTRNLLGFCGRRDATLHVVDPAPQYDVPAWRREYGERLVFHEGLSLDVLPTIDRFDVVLIDGDHNWYTVFNELRLIERLSDERSQDFPLVVLHDVGWPYGRRDHYYAPERIPADQRHPYKRKGVQPGTKELVDEGGLHRNTLNATLEGAPRSGVLTAVEDFLVQTPKEIRLVVVAGLHGLGILVPPDLADANPAVRSFIDGLEPSPAIASHLERVELACLEALAGRQDAAWRLRRLHARQREQIEDLRVRLKQERKVKEQLTERLARAEEELRETRERGALGRLLSSFGRGPRAD